MAALSTGRAAPGAALVSTWSFSAGSNSVIEALDYAAGHGELLVSSTGTSTSVLSATQPSQVSAVDEVSGKTVWSLTTGSQVAHSLASVGGVVIAVMGSPSNSTESASGQQVWALSMSDGAQLWSADMAVVGNGNGGVGLSGQSLVSVGGDGLSAVSVLSGQSLWRAPNVNGCSDLGGAADDVRIAVLQKCDGALSVRSVDPSTGRGQWMTAVSASFDFTRNTATVAVYGADTIVTQQGSETLLSANGAILDHFSVATDVSAAFTGEWLIDSAGDLERIAATQGALSWTAYDPLTGKVARQSTWKDVTLPAAQALSAQPGSTYALVGLPKPDAAEGLYAVNSATARSTLYVLPTVASATDTVAASPTAVFVSESGPANTGTVVAFDRTQLDGTGVPVRPYPAHWPQACALLPAAALSAATGHPYGGYAAPSPSAALPDASTCRYATTAADQPGLVLDVVWDGSSRTETSNMTAEKVESVMVDPITTPLEPLPGVGDQAYEILTPRIASDPQVGNADTVFVQDGTLLIVLTASGSTTLAATAARMVVAGLNHQGER